jgi:hypothetical protein
MATDAKQYRQQYYLKNREKALAYAKAYAAANPDKVKAQLERYRAKHREELSRKRRESREANIDAAREAARAAYAANPERHRAYRANYVRRNPEKAWEWFLRDHYKMTRDQYVALLAAQGGACAICGQPETARKNKRLSVDHDHRCCPTSRTCGACVRGLLCHHCNATLGHIEKMGEGIDWTAAAARYLDRWPRR